jgi:hypothetical protein
MQIKSSGRHAALIGGCVTAVASAGTFFVVRLTSQSGGGYSDLFFALGLLTVVFLVGSCIGLLRLARTGNGAREAVSFCLATSLVLLVLGVAAGLRG